MPVTETIPLCAPARTDITNTRFTMPAHACDCHAHVFTPAREASLVPDRTYTPPPASLGAYRHLLSTLGFSRGVIVQPSVYGTDNSVTLNAVADGGDNFRAVVVVCEDISMAELRAMHAAGARGARVNLLFRSSAQINNMQISNLKSLAAKLAELGWHLQLLIDVSQFADLYSSLADLPVPTVFDHMGHMPVPQGINHPGFQAMLRLMSEGKSWAKLSGSYRFTGQQETPYGDVTAFARAIIAANPDQVIYGSDWPHPHFNIPMPEDGALLNMLADWAPDAHLRQKIMVSNPARLYDFPA